VHWTVTVWWASRSRRYCPFWPLHEALLFSPIAGLQLTGTAGFQYPCALKNDHCADYRLLRHGIRDRSGTREDRLIQAPRGLGHTQVTLLQFTAHLLRELGEDRQEGRASAKGFCRSRRKCDINREGRMYAQGTARLPAPAKWSTQTAHGRFRESPVAIRYLQVPL
jgi:hypothetical protein